MRLVARPGVRSKYPISRTVNPLAAQTVPALAGEKFRYWYQEIAVPARPGAQDLGQFPAPGCYTGGSGRREAAQSMPIP